MRLGVEILAGVHIWGRARGWDVTPLLPVLYGCPLRSPVAASNAFSYIYALRVNLAKLR